LFTQALAIAPHLCSSGLSGMVYEHLLGCFIPKDPSSRFSKLFQVVVALGDIHRSMALVLGVSRLLAMEKNTKGLCLITIGEMFFRLINCSIVLQLRGHFKNTYPPISLEYRPLKVVRPSLFGIRTFLDLHLDWVMIQVNIKNIFNNVY